MPVSRLNACNAYTTFVQVTRESDARSMLTSIEPMTDNLLLD